MRYKALLTLLLGIFAGTANANWEKVNDLDYTWGPFKIYNIALFTETGQYEAGIRPLMIKLEYAKPVDGRDFAISIARSWATLGINLPKQEETIEHLRKTIPDLKPNDKLHYIALPDTGYFVLNDNIIPEQFDKDFNNAMVAVWLDPKIDFSAKLTTKKTDPNVQEVHNSKDYQPNEEMQNGMSENATATTENSVQTAPETTKTVNEGNSAQSPNSNEQAPTETKQTTEAGKQEEPKTPVPNTTPSELESPEKQVDPIGDPAPSKEFPLS